MGKKSRYVNKNAEPPDRMPLARRVSVFIWPLLPVSFGALLLILTCAGLYWVGSAYGWGIRPTFLADPSQADAYEPTPLECLYFSVVTVATLGYGDFRPVSWGRGIAAVEVLAGLVVAGVFVSQLVSQRQERLTIRMLKAVMNQEIQSFRDQAMDLAKDMNGGALSMNARGLAPFLKKTRGLVKSIARYWRHECMHPDLKRYVPEKAVHRLHGDLADLLRLLEAPVAQQCGDGISREDRTAIIAIVDSVQGVSDIVVKYVGADEGDRSTSASVSRSAEVLRNYLRA
jgi:hypothetical protein